MKTVRIPKWNNPFVVYVNNRKYSYPAGTIQIVPNEVADAINNVIINMPKEKNSTSILEAINELKGEIDALKVAYNPENVITKTVYMHELSKGVYTVKGSGVVKCYKEGETTVSKMLSVANAIIVYDGLAYQIYGGYKYVQGMGYTLGMIKGQHNGAKDFYSNTINWKEDASNKTTSIAATGTGSDAKYPTEKAVKSYVASVLSDS